MNDLADCLLDGGRAREATPLYREALELSVQVGGDRGIAYSLAGLAAASADRRAAARLWGALRRSRSKRAFRLLSEEGLATSAP